MTSCSRSTVLFLAIAVALFYIPTGCSSVANDTPQQASQGSNSSTGSGTSGSGTGSSGSGSSGSGNSGSGSGSGSSGSGSSGSGSSGSGSSGSGSSGSGSGSSGSSGSGSSGSGSGSTGSGSSGSGSSGSGSGSGSSGSGSSGSGNSGSGNSGSGTSNSGNSGLPSVVPSTAVAVNAIQGLGNWQEADDAGTSGSASGIMSLVTLPSLSGQAREFATSYTSGGGERYWVSFGSDPSATNFLYDTWIYLANSGSGVDTLEFDMNQVTTNGQTVIYGVQCDGNAHTWDYTENAGSPTNYVDHWIESQQSCNAHNWAADTWHHIQVWYSRDASGNVTYHSIWLDGTEQPIDATVPSSFALGWASVLLTNFQVDGQGSSGSSTAYLDKLTIYRW